MSLLPCIVGKKALGLVPGVMLLLAAMGSSVILNGADSIPQPPISASDLASAPVYLQPATAPSDDGAIPQALKGEVFEALVTNSPFTRSLGVSDTLILTGVAQFEQDVYATLFDTRTLESQVVSKAANFQGWHLVGVHGDPSRMQTWTAKIQVPGGEVVSIRYQKPPPKISRKLAGTTNGGPGSATGNAPPLSNAQVTEAKQAAVNYKEGFSSDGYPRQPPAEMVAKLSRLSVSQREEINRQMIGHSNRGLGLNDRRKIYEGLVDKAGQGRR